MLDRIEGHTFYAGDLNPDPVVLDLGAHRGQFARQMRARYSGTYYLVEANPTLADALRHEGQFPVWNCAVAATDGRIALNVAQNDKGSSILTLPTKSVNDCVLQETIQVQSRALDSLTREMDPARIDLLKMDIEGAEVVALAGLSDETLGKVGQISVEFHSARVFGFDLRRDVEAVIRSLKRRGFWCFDFSHHARCDVLFVNSRCHRIAIWRRVAWRLRTNPLWLGNVWGRLPDSVRGLLRPPLKRIQQVFSRRGYPD